MTRVRHHLTYSNVVSTLCLFLLLGGGVAYAANTVRSSDIVDGEVKNQDLAANSVGTAKIADGHVRTTDVLDNDLTAIDIKPESIGPGRIADNTLTGGEILRNSLTGDDVANKSGVDTCVNTVRLDNLCFRAENQARTWIQAAAHCANLNLRLPTYGEARSLATSYDLPNVDESERFWTDEIVMETDGELSAFLEYDAGNSGGSERAAWTITVETVCVTTPTN